VESENADWPYFGVSGGVPKEELPERAEVFKKGDRLHSWENDGLIGSLFAPSGIGHLSVAGFFAGSLGGRGHLVSRIKKLHGRSRSYLWFEETPTHSILKNWGCSMRLNL